MSAASTTLERIAPKSGTAFELKRGELLRVTDPEGQQVSDLVAFNAHDPEEYLSSGRSIDYASRMFLSTGDLLYSNRSNPMFEIGRDDVGRHDFTLTPCSRDTFRILYDDHPILPGCQGNLEAALAPYGIGPDRVPIAFNVFMHVDVDSKTGEIRVLPPKSRAGDSVEFEAKMDLIVAMTACSAGQSNNFAYKPIDYEIIG
ncbi:MAG: urea carboxylase-associated family protein [Pseudomonadota bacterium]